MLTVELGSYVDGEAHGWDRYPYGRFDPAPRPRDIIHTYFYRRRPRLAHPEQRVKGRSAYMRPHYQLHLLHG